MNYRLLIDYDVIEFLETLPRRDQRLLRNRFVEIREFPGRFSDATDYDASGRRVEIHVCGKYAVKFWEDGADQHVKILDVHLADRPGR